MNRLRHLATLSVLLLSGATFAQDRSQTRSMVITQYGVAAAEHPFAAQAAANILAEGGNAVDAAIAANAVMGVVEPMMNGLGGDLFALVYDASTGKLQGLNASGWAPSGLTVDFIRSLGLTEVPVSGIHSVTVPGAVDGWDKLNARYGKLDLARILRPAIRIAEEGYPVTEWVNAYWKLDAAVLAQDPESARTYLINGAAPAVGQVFRNPNLAWSLRQLAEGGRDAYYLGPIAQRILATSARRGGTMTADDLAQFSSEWVTPISTTYRGWTVYEIGPQTQGIAALEMLNMMENFPMGMYGFGSANALHVEMEAKKLAYADLLAYIGDPNFSKINVRGLLDKTYAAQRAKLIDMAHASPGQQPGIPPPEADTTYLTVVDRNGNMVSLIQSNFLTFGSKVVVDGAGFVLHNRGNLFTLDPSSPNVLAPHKRPLQTIIPAFMEKGPTKISFGIMGGLNQAQAHAQFVSNIVDHRMNVQAAMEAPRFTKRDFPGVNYQIENRFAPSVLKELTSRGHVLEVRGAFATTVGGGQAILRDSTSGVNFAASDPRKDGEAIPEPLRKDNDDGRALQKGDIGPDTETDSDWDATDSGGDLD